MKKNQNIKKVQKAVQAVVNSAKMIVRCMEAMYADKEWDSDVSKTYKQLFLFLYYNSQKVLLDRIEAFVKAKKLNEAMLKPISSEEFQIVMEKADICVGAPLKGFDNSFYSYKPETVAIQLGLSDDERVKYGFCDNVIKKENGAIHQDASVMRDWKIYSLMSQGANQTTIATMLHNDFCCSRTTVGRVMHKIEELQYYNVTITKDVLRDVERYSKHKKSVQLSLTFPTREKKLEVDEVFINEELGMLYQKLISVKIDKREQDVAIAKLKETQLVFLGGRAGAGKSTILCNYFNALSKEEKNKTVVVAPTGAAAERLNISCRTIHSAFKLEINKLYNTSDDIIELPWFKNVSRIIIDEISLVRIDIFEYIMRCIEYINHHYNKKIQVIVCGDFGQGSPVISDEQRAEYYKIYGNKRYSFESLYWNFEKIMLYNNRRLADEDRNAQFSADVEMVKFGCISAMWRILGYVSREADDDAVYICTENRIVDQFNEKYISRFSDYKEYKAYGNSQYGPKRVLRLAIGMRVMMLMNTKTYKNGTIGTICSLGEDYVEVIVQRESRHGKVCNRKIKVFYEVFHDSNGKEVMSQLPLQIAGAMTITKSQGLSLDKVNVILEGYFSEGSLYVALTRCRNINNLHIIGKFDEEYLTCDINALSMCVE